MKEGNKIIVRQVRGLSGRNQRVRATIKALGLGKIGAERQHTVSPALVGMISRVEHLVKIYSVN